MGHFSLSHMRDRVFFASGMPGKKRKRLNDDDDDKAQDQTAASEDDVDVFEIQEPLLPLRFALNDNGIEEKRFDRDRLMQVLRQRGYEHIIDSFCRTHFIAPRRGGWLDFRQYPTWPVFEFLRHWLSQGKHYTGNRERLDQADIDDIMEFAITDVLKGDIYADLDPGRGVLDLANNLVNPRAFVAKYGHHIDWHRMSMRCGRGVHFPRAYHAMFDYEFAAREMIFACPRHEFDDGPGHKSVYRDVVCQASKAPCQLAFLTRHIELLQERAGLDGTDIDTVVFAGELEGQVPIHTQWVERVKLYRTALRKLVLSLSNVLSGISDLLRLVATYLPQ